MTYFVIKINISVNVINKEIMQRTKQQPTTVKCFPGFPEHLPFPILSVMVAIKRNVCECGSFFFPSAALTTVSFPSSPAVDRMPADEDRTTQAQHIHHPLPAVDHCHRAHLPCGDPRGEARETRTHTHTHKYTRAPRYANLCLQSRKILIIYMWESGVTF